MINHLKIGILLVLLGILAVLFFVIPSEKKRSWNKLMEERETATRLLAENVAGRFPGKMALIVGNPFITQKDQAAEIVAVDNAGVRGLKEGFGSTVKVKDVAHPEIKPQFFKDPSSVFIEPSTTTPLSYIVNDDAFDRVLEAHPGCEILASLIGLPADLAKTRFWSSEKGPHLALLLPDLRIVGNREAIRSAFKSGKLTAVFYKPGAGNAPRVEDRFIVLTDDNIDEWLKLYWMGK